MTSFYRRYSFAVFLVLLGVLTPVVHDFLVPQLPPPQDNPRPPANTMAMQTIHFLQHRGNMPEIDLRAARAFSDDIKQHLLLTDIDVTIHGGQDKTGRITGDNALFDSSRQELTITDNVHATFDALRADTEKIRYYLETKMVTAPNAITLTGQRLTVTGSGLSYDLGGGAMAIGDGNSRVVCRFRPGLSGPQNQRPR